MAAAAALDAMLVRDPRVAVPTAIPFRMSHNFNEFCNWNNIPEGVEANILFAMCIRATELPGGMGVNPALGLADIRFNEATPGAGVGAANVITPWGYGLARTGNFVAPASDATVDFIEEVLAGAIHWIVDLVACHQVKPISHGSVTNYFKQGSNARVGATKIQLLIAYLAGKLPVITSDATLWGRVVITPFIEMHTSFSSTPKLAREALGAINALTALVFTPAEIATVAHACAALHDQARCAAIPPKVVLFTYAYLAAYGKLPDGWKQGEKVKSSLPATMYLPMREVFNKAKEFTANTAGITGAANMAALLAHVQANPL